MAVNAVSISGNLVREPEMRNTASGMAVLGFSVAVNDRRKNSRTGEWEDYPNFIDVSVLGNRAQALSQILHKGMKVCVGGKLRQDRWQDRQTGQNRSAIKVLADEVDLMSRQDAPGGRSGASEGGYGGGHRNGPQNAPQFVEAQTYDAPQGGSYAGENIPF